MNLKSKRSRLIVEFKQFQRLPDWPAIVKLAERDHSSKAGAGEKTVPATQDDATRSFAE